MRNVPKKIWLNVGEEADIADTDNFKELAEVTWSDCKINDGDIGYVRLATVQRQNRERDQKDLNHLKEIIDRFEMGGMNKLYAIEMLEHWRDELDTIVNLKKH